MLFPKIAPKYRLESGFTAEWTLQAVETECNYLGSCVWFDSKCGDLFVQAWGEIIERVTFSTKPFAKSLRDRSNHPKAISQTTVQIEIKSCPGFDPCKQTLLGGWLMEREFC